MRRDAGLAEHKQGRKPEAQTPTTESNCPGKKRKIEARKTFNCPDARQTEMPKDLT
jgi:hypothetical protein